MGKRTDPLEKAVCPSSNQEAPETVSTLQARAWEAFCQDLEGLLRTDRGKWVAYRGRERLCLADSQSAAYQECLRRGFAPAALFVELIYPAAAEEPTVFLPSLPDSPAS